MFYFIFCYIIKLIDKKRIRIEIDFILRLKKKTFLFQMRQSITFTNELKNKQMHEDAQE